MAEGEDPAGWLAAAAYQAAGVFDKALLLYEKLAQRSPRAVNYQLALAALYERAGAKEKAAAALERAKELGAKGSE